MRMSPMPLFGETRKVSFFYLFLFLLMKTLFAFVTANKEISP